MVMHMQDMMQLVQVKGIYPHTVVIDAPDPIRGRTRVHAIRTHRALAHNETHLNCYYCYYCDVLVGPSGPIRYCPCHFALRCIRCNCCPHVQQYPERVLKFTFHIFPKFHIREANLFQAFSLLHEPSLARSCSHTYPCNACYSSPFVSEDSHFSMHMHSTLLAHLYHVHRWSVSRRYYDLDVCDSLDWIVIVQAALLPPVCPLFVYGRVYHAESYHHAGSEDDDAWPYASRTLLSYPYVMGPIWVDGCVCSCRSYINKHTSQTSTSPGSLAPGPLGILGSLHITPGCSAHGYMKILTHFGRALSPPVTAPITRSAWPRGVPCALGVLMDLPSAYPSVSLLRSAMSLRCIDYGITATVKLGYSFTFARMVPVPSTYNTPAFGSVLRSFSLFHHILNFHLFQPFVHLWSLSCTCYTGRDQCVARIFLLHCRGQHEREATASHFSHLFPHTLGSCDLFHCLDVYRIFATYISTHIYPLITDSRLSSQFVAHSSLSPCSTVVAHVAVGAHITLIHPYFT